MKKIGISILGLFITLSSFSKSSDSNQEKLRFGIVLEQRITPIYISGFQGLMNEEDFITPIFYAQDEQLSGTAVGYEVSYWFKKINSSLIFSQTFRYDHIYFDTDYLRLIGNVVHQSVNDLITDYHFKIEKHFNLKNNYLLNLGIGYSFMNRGTAYSYTRQSDEYEGQPLFSTTHNDFNFSTFNFELGIEKNKLNFAIGNYISDKHKYNQPSQILIPYVKLGYKFSFR